MTGDIDLHVNMCNITFRNPVLSAASEIAYDVRSVKKCVQHGCGGVVLKSTMHPNVPVAGRRPIPNMASLRPLGADFKSSFLADPIFSHIKPDEFINKELPEIVKLCRDSEVPVIGSISASDQVDEWIELAEKFADKGIDMLEINLSCPHTILFDGKGLKVGATIAEDIELAGSIIRAVKKAVDIPVSVKMSPRLEPSGYFARAYADAGIDALSAHNSPVGMVIDVDREEEFGTYSGGYLAGRTFLPISLAKINEIMKIVKVPISGMGGIINAIDALQYILLGCPTVQVCTAIMVYGYGQFGKIIKGITDWMESKGYTSIEEFRGKVKPKDPKELPLCEPFEYKSPELALGPATIKIDTDKCNLCGNCVEICLYDAFEIRRNNKVINFHDEKCYNCGMCVGLCPKGALKLVDRKNGETLWDGRGLQKKVLPSKQPL